MKNFKYKIIFVLFGLLIFCNYTAAMEEKKNCIKKTSTQMNKIKIIFNGLNVDKFIDDFKNTQEKDLCVALEGAHESFFGISKLKKEDVSKVLQILENRMKKLELVSINSNQIDFEQFQKSNIAELVIITCDNFDKYLFQKLIPHNLQTLTIDQEITDDFLEGLPPKLIRLDVCKAHGLTGKFLEKLPASLKELKLGRDTNIEDLKYLSIAIEFLCLEKTNIKNWEKLKKISKILKLRVNNNFRDEHIDYLPDNLKLLDLSPVTDFSLCSHHNLTGEMFRRLPKSIKLLVLFCLQNIEKNNLYDLKKNISVVIKCQSPYCANDLKHKEKIEALIERGIKVLDKNMAKYKVEEQVEEQE